MKEMTLQEVQQVSLDVMQNIHDFCIANNVKYSLCGGSLIGTFRHKGFIPWDDDIDIAMPRADYERFCKLYQDSDRYKLFCLERSNSDMTFARVCEMQRTRVKPYCKCFTEQTGIWVDIFPFDRVDDNHDVYIKKLKSLRRFSTLLFLRRYISKPTQEVAGFLDKIKLICYKCLFRFDIIKLLTKYNQKCINFCDGETYSIGCVAFLQYFGKEHYSKKMMETTFEAPFEDRHFMVMNGYEEYLHKVYGNYMEIPPVEKRVQHSGQTNYWK